MTIDSDEKEGTMTPMEELIDKTDNIGGVDEEGLHNGESAKEGTETRYDIRKSKYLSFAFDSRHVWSRIQEFHG